MNSVPSPIGGPKRTYVVAKRARANYAIVLHITGTNFDSTGIIAYVANSKTWWNPGVYADGSSSSESSRQTGKTTLFTGSYVDARTGTTTQIRDTYTVSSMTDFSDLSEARIGGTWKTTAKISCTKS